MPMPPHKTQRHPRCSEAFDRVFMRRSASARAMPPQEQAEMTACATRLKVLKNPEHQWDLRTSGTVPQAAQSGRGVGTLPGGTR